MKVKSVKPCGRADVFNMEVEDTHEYAVAGGIIVHNCDETRYLCMSRPIKPIIPAKPRVMLTDPLNQFTDY